MYSITKQRLSVDTAIVAAFMCTSCAVKPPSEEETMSTSIDIPAVVVQAYCPSYSRPHIMWGLGPCTAEERESILRGVGSGWSQTIVVQAEDNKLYKGKIIITCGSMRHTTVVGDKGIATVFLGTDKLYCFHKNGIEPWHKHPAEPGKINKKAWLKVGSVSGG